MTQRSILQERQAAQTAAQITQAAMGTVMAHKAFGPQAEECLAAVRREIDRLEGLLSRFIPASDVSRINASAGIRGVPVRRETYAVLAKAVEFSQACPGCFDVTIEPLVRLWQRSKADGTIPADEDIQHALALVNYRDILLDPRDRYSFKRSVELRWAGQAIDLGGIGKGCAGDRVRTVYQEYEIASAYSNLGGNVVTLGSRPDGSPWQIGIQHPRDESRILGAVAVVDQAVVTSGDYQRCYTDRQGIRRHHILDPKTGFPADAGLISVTIVAENAMAADALSTSVFVAGMERGLETLRRFPRSEAILVDTGLNVFVTYGLRDRFTADQGVGVTVLD